MDSHLRSLAKGLSWRVLATVVTMIVAFSYSGEVAMAALVGSTDAVAKIFLYWAHERAWLEYQVKEYLRPERLKVRGLTMDSHLRSVVKGLSWRVLATVVTTVVVYVYSGELGIAALVGSTDAIAKIGLYWAHERVWQHVRWGRLLPSVSSP